MVLNKNRANNNTVTIFYDRDNDQKHFTKLNKKKVSHAFWFVLLKPIVLTPSCLVFLVCPFSANMHRSHCITIRPFSFMNCPHLFSLPHLPIPVI